MRSLSCAVCREPAHRTQALAPGVDLLGQPLVLDFLQLIASKVAWDSEVPANSWCQRSITSRIDHESASS